MLYIVLNLTSCEEVLSKEEYKEVVFISSPNVYGELFIPDTTPTLSWDTPLKAEEFRYSFTGNSDWNITRETSFTPEKSLSEGFHNLYVQARGEHVYWSESGSWQIYIETKPIINGAS